MADNATLHPNSDLNNPIRPEIRIQRLRRITAWVADYPRAVDFIIERFMHVAMDPQRCPIPDHALHLLQTVFAVSGQTLLEHVACAPGLPNSHKKPAWQRQ